MSVRRIYLDACLFIAQQRPDQRQPEDVQNGIRSLMNEIERGQAIGIASTLMISELLDGSLEILNACFDSKKGRLVEVTEHIALEARRIRNRLVRGQAKLDLPDCIHLATAIDQRCDCIATIDGLNSRKHKLLSNAVEIEALFGLRVLLPQDAVRQGILNFDDERPAGNQE